MLNYYYTDLNNAKQVVIDGIFNMSKRRNRIKSGKINHDAIAISRRNNQNDVSEAAVDMEIDDATSAK